MRRYAVWMLAVGAAVTGVSCGEQSDGDPVAGPPDHDAAHAAVPLALALAVAEPASAQECTFAPGPVARLAISPRELRTDGVQADVFVRARPNWDEVVCLDRTKSHRLDFNANQRNADGRESCYEGDVDVAGRGRSGEHDHRQQLAPRATD